MHASSIITFTILVTFLAFMLGQATSSVRYFLRKIQSEKWPTVLAIIERHEVRSSGYIRAMPIADRSFFNYDFAVSGKSYSCQFFIFAETYSAVQLQQELDGQTISARIQTR